MTQPDNIKNLYEALKNEYDLGSEQDFRTSMSDKNNRQTLYNTIKDEYDLGTQDDFEKSLGYSDTPKKQSAPKPQPATQKVSQPIATNGTANNKGQAKQEDKEPGLLQTVFGGGKVAGAEAHKTDGSGLVGLLLNSVAKQQPTQPTDGNTEEEKRAIDAAKYQQLMNEQNRKIADYGKEYNNTLQGIKNSNPETRTPTLNYEVRVAENSPQEFADKGTFIGKDGKPHKKLIGTSSPEDISQEAYAVSNEFSKKKADEIARIIVSHMPEHISTDDSDNEELRNAYYNKDAVDMIAEAAGAMGMTYHDFFNVYVRPRISNAVSERYRGRKVTAPGLSGDLGEVAKQGKSYDERWMNDDERAMYDSLWGLFHNDLNKLQAEGEKASLAEWKKNHEGTQLPGYTGVADMGVGAMSERAKNYAADPQKAVDDVLNKLYAEGGSNGGRGATEDMDRQAIGNLLYRNMMKYLIDQRVPKSKWGYVLQGFADSDLGEIFKAVTKTQYERHLDNLANDKYVRNLNGFTGLLAQGGHEATKFLADAWEYWLGGKAGKAVTGAIRRRAIAGLTADLTARGIAETEAKDIAIRIANARTKSAAEKAFLHAASGSATLGSAQAISGGLRQGLTPAAGQKKAEIQERRANGETISKEQEDKEIAQANAKAHSVGAIAKSAGASGLSGAFTGATFGAGSFAGDATSKFLGKYFGDVTSAAGGYLAKFNTNAAATTALGQAEGALTGQQPEGSTLQQFARTWVNFAMLDSMNYAPKVLGGHPIRDFRQWKEYERAMGISEEDQDRMRNLGYGDLMDTVDGLVSDRLRTSNPNAGTELSTQRQAEPPRETKVNQGMLNMLADPRIPEELKRKYYTVVTGDTSRQLSPIVASEITQDEDGNTYLVTYNKNGNVVSDRQYRNEQVAKEAQMKIGHEQDENLTEALQQNVFAKDADAVMEEAYNAAAEAYKNGGKLNNGQRTLIYLYQNKAQLTKAIQAMASGEPLSDADKKLVNLYNAVKNTLYSMDGNIPRIVNDVEEDNGLGTGGLQKARKGHTEKEAKRIVKETGEEIVHVGGDVWRTMSEDQAVKDYQKRLYDYINDIHEGTGENVAEPKGLPGRTEQPTDTQEQTTQPEQTTGEGDVALQRPTQPEEPTHPEQPTNEVGDVAQQRPTQQETEPGTEQPAQPTDTQQPSQPSGTAQPTGRYSVNSDAVSQLTPEQMKNLSGYVIGFVNEHPDVVSNDIQGKAEATAKYLNGETNDRDYLIALGYATGEENTFLDSPTTTQEEIAQEAQQNAQKYSSLLNDSEAVQQPTEGNAQQPQGEEQPAQPEGQSQVQTVREQGRQRGLSVESDETQLAQIQEDSDLANKRFNNAFAGNQLGEFRNGLIQAVEDDDEDAIQALFDKYGDRLSTEQREAAMGLVENGAVQNGIEESITNQTMQYQDARKQELDGISDSTGNITEITLQDGSTVYYKSGDITNQYGGIIVVDDNGDPQQIPVSSIAQVGQPTSAKAILDEDTNNFAQGLRNDYQAMASGASMLPGQETTINVGGQNFHATMETELQDGSVQLRLDDGSPLVLTPDQLQQARKAARDANTTQQLADAEQQRQMKEREDRYNKGVVGYGEGNPDFSAPKTDARTAAELMHEQDKQAGKASKERLSDIQSERDKLNDQIRNAQWEMSRQQRWLDLNGDTYSEEERASKQAIIDGYQQQINEWQQRVRKLGEVRNAYMSNEERRQFQSNRRKTMDDVRKNTELGIKNGGLTPTTPQNGGQPQVEVPDAKTLLEKYPTQADANAALSEMRDNVMKSYRDGSANVLSDVRAQLRDYEEGMSDLGNDELQNLYLQQAGAQQAEETDMQQVQKIKNLQGQLSNIYKDRNKAALNEMSPRERRATILSGAKTPEELQQKAHEAYDGSELESRLDDTEPETLEEYVSQNMPTNLNWEGTGSGITQKRGLKQELGLSRGIGRNFDSNGINSLLAPKGQGISVDEAAHALWEGRPSQFEGATTQDMRNTLLDLIANSPNARSIKSLTIRNRINEVEGYEQAAEEQEQWLQQQADEEAKARQAEIDTYNDYLDDTVKDTVPSDEVSDYLSGLYADEIAKAKEEAEEQEQAWRDYEKEKADAEKAAQEKQSLEPNNNDNGTEREDGTGEGVDSEPKQPTVHAGNGEGEAPLRAEETHKPNAEVQHNAQGRTNAGTEAAPTGSGTTDGGVSLPTVKKVKAVAQQRRTQHVDFAAETEEQSKAFEESIPKMTDEELLGYIAQDSPDATKQYHPALGDEYDYRHRDEEQDYYNFYEPMLDEEYSKGGREAVEGTYNKAWQDWVNGGYASAEDRTRLSAQINACEDWLSEHDKENSLGATDTPEKVDAERQKVNTDPTEAQKEAGNYKKGHIKVDGYDISIENPKGSVREKKDANGKVLWRTPMHYDYGYIKNTKGTDGDHIDVYLSDTPTEGNVYVVDQVNQSDGSFDEHKVMYGFPSMEAARDAYKSQYEDGWKVGTITEVSREDFKKWVESSTKKTKPFSEYKSVKEAAALRQHTQPDTTPTLKEPAVYKNNLAGGDAYANIEGNPKSGYVVRYYDNLNDAKAKNPIAIGVENMTSEQLADHLQKGDFAPTEKSQEFADMLGTSPDKLREILNDTNKHNNYNTYGRLDEFKKGIDKEKGFALVDKIYGKQNKKYMYNILLGKMIWEFLDNKGQTLPTKKEKGETNNNPLVKAAQETGHLVIGGVPGPTDSANEPKPIGHGDFGPIYNQFEGKPKEAFEFITKKKSGDLLNVFHRNDTGGIDLVWGDEKGGLNHIIVKHVGKGKDFETEADAFSKIEDVLKNGKLIQSGQLRYVVSEDGYRVAIRKDYNGNKKNWIVSAVDYNRSKEEKGITTNPTSASHGANGSELAAPGNSTGKDSNNNPNAQENGEKNDVVDKVIAESERRKALAKRIDDIGVDYNVNWPYNLTTQTAKEKNWVITKRQKAGKRSTGAIVKVGFSGNDLYMRTKEGVKRVNNAKDYTAAEIAGRVNLGIGVTTDEARLLGDAILELYQQNDMPISEQPILRPLISSKKKKATSAGQQLDLFGNFTEQQPSKSDDNKANETTANKNENQLKGKKNDLRGTDELRTEGLQADDHHEGEHTPRQSETIAQGREAADRKGEAESVRRVRSSDDERLRPGNELEPEEEPEEEPEAAPEHPLNRRNNHAERGVDYAPKGVDDRIEANIKAIELSQQITEEGRAATPDEMKVLRKYSGWGGLGKAFKEKQHPWETDGIAEQLKSLLGDEGYEQAVMSRNSAYFTPANVIDTMWDIARALGFKGGNVLEGSAGIGNIIGLMPQDMSDRSHIQAVEIDSTSGNILSLLYPEAKTDIQGFEKTKIRNGSVDLAITNVPFVTGLHVNDTTGDGDLSRKFGDIHDFCIAKNIRKLRPGGIGIFITSNGTLDKSQKLRDWIVSDGDSDVVGAFRMNNSTFGGTSATSDIIVVRRRVNGEKVPNAIDVSNIGVERVAKVKVMDRRGNYEEKPYSIDYNQYFIDHPENMGGKMYLAGEKGDTYRPTSKGLFPVPGISQAERMKEWVKKLAESAKEWKKARPARKTQGKTEEEQKVYEALGDDVHEGSMLVDSKGNLCVATYGEAVPIKVNKNKVKGHTKIECFNAYSRIKDAVKAVLDYQTKHEDNEGLEPLIKKLNQAYDSFVATYGHLNKNVAIAFLKRDMDYSSIAALETFKDSNDKNGKRVTTYGKTDIFKQRVIEKETEPKPTNIKDGVITSIYQYGKLDLNYIAEQLGKTPDEVKKEIISSGLGFEDPVTRETQVSYEYLSGNVREKLHQAEEANEDGQYNNNIQALKKVIPMDIPSHLIDFTLGSSWLDSTLYDEYIKDRTGIDVTTSNVNGTWAANVPKYGLNTEKNRTFGVHSSMFNTDVYGTDLIIAAMKNKTIGVSRVEKHADGKSETVTDKDATTMCAQRIEEIRDDFKDWARGKMQNDPDLAKKYEDRYNEQFNNYVPREIPDNFLPEYFAGANHAIHLRAHQAKAAIRATMQNVLFAHEVGSGKTFTLITTAMEMRRLGTAKKPLIVVQNATVGQFVASAKFLYPNAKILTIDDKEHDEQGRRAFYAKVKYNDWDMIVIPQSVLEKIPDSDERQLKFIQDKVAEKEAVLAQMQNSDMDDPFVTRRAEKELADLQDQMQEITQHMNEHKKERDSKKAAVARQNAAVKAQEMLNRKVDDVENFDDMGIDAFLVDEAHEYKHLGFATAMQRGVKGIDPSYSKKCAGVYLKCQSVMEKSGGKNVVFATGTPISNTAAEIWTFMKYLMPEDRMKSYGIYYFDDFVRNFGTLSQMPEFNTSGQFVEVNRFRGYSNLPELVRIWSGVADTVLSSEVGDLSAKIPKMKSGKAIDVYLPQSRSLRAVMKYVREQLKKFNEMSGKEKRANSAIPLKMYNIAKQAAVDPRLVSSNSPDEPNSKTNAAVKETLKSLDESKAYRGTIAIFADNYQNSDGMFNLFDDIKKKLVAKGVPENEIVIIRPSMKVNKKTEIFDKLNAGEVRVVMGTTFTLGTGANFQERLYTLINIDAPNRPMDYTQRLGRILRQGNLHREWGIPVKVIRFGVEDSLDVTAYQRLKTKGAIADSIMHGKQLMKNSMENRTIEEEEDQFGDTVAQLSGSQYAMLKQGAEREVKKWENKKKQWEADQVYIHAAKPRLKGQIEEAQKRADYNAKGLQYLEEHKGDGTIVAGKQRFKNVEAMGDFIKNFNKTVKANEDEMRKSRDQSPRAISVNLSIDGVNFKITMRLDRDMMSNGRSLFEKISRDMRYYCPQLTGDWGVPVKGDLLRNALEDITQNVMTGNDLRERKKSAENEVTRLKGELEQVVSREGKPFQYGDKLADAEKKLADFTEKMKAELEEKQKKYAAIDAEVEEVTPDDVNTDGGDTEQSEDGDKGTLYRMADDDEAAMLDKEPTVKVYRAMQLIDGKLYPPMMAAVKGKLVEPRELGQWEVADERPDIITHTKMNKKGEEIGYVKLDKGSKTSLGKRGTPIPAAYNPYWHTSRSPLNDQFKSAWIRPNIVTVEVEIPESELTSGYRAKYAKDHVGETDWLSGVVTKQLTAQGHAPRKVILSRYDKPVRVLSAAETAERIIDYIGDYDVTIPENVVTPQVRVELEKRGIKIGAPEKGVKKTEQIREAIERGLSVSDDMLRDVEVFEDGERLPIIWREDGISVEGLNNEYDNAGQLLDAFREKYPDYISTIYDEDGRELPPSKAYSRQSDYKHPVLVVEPLQKYLAGYTDRRAVAMRQHTQRQQERAQETVKSWARKLNLGDKVAVITDDSKLTGKKAKAKGWFDTKSGKIAIVLPKHNSIDDVVRTILHEGVAHYGLRKLFGDKFDTFLDNVWNNASVDVKGRLEKLAIKYDGNQRKATEEYLSGLAEDTDFDRAMKSGWWGKIKNFFISMLAKAGIRLKHLLTDNDLRYILWRSYQNMVHPGEYRDGIKETAEDVEPIDDIDPIDVIEGRARVAEPMPRRGSATREHTESEKQHMQRAAEEAGESLGGVKISVERNGHDGIKGSYNTEDDTVHVNLDEADDAEDIQATVSHEVLGHEGLKALFGSNKGVDAFGEFIYDNAGKALRRKIVERAAEEGYEWDDPLRYSKAAQEVFSDIASEGPANADEFSLWRKVKHYVIKAAKKLGLHIKGLVNDHDLRYYVLKTGKAVKTWTKMSDADRAEAAEPGRIMHSRRGKPKQKKGESMAHYIQRLREYEMWKNAEQRAREANDPLPEREDYEKKAQEEFNKAMDDWRNDNGITSDTEQPDAFPKRKDGETPQEYAIRVADYESELDKWKTAPNVFDYLKKGEDAYRQAYEDWKVRYDIQEMEDVDEKLYGEAKQEPSEPESEEEHYKKMEIDAAVDKDLGDAVGVDTGVDGARRQAKLAVIERRKNLESASAEDAIFIHDLCKDIDDLAKELGMSKERLRSNLITIIEEPRQQKEGDDEVERWVEILNKMRAFQDAHTSITADGVKAARQELSDLAHEIHNHGYKPSTGEGRQSVHDAAVRLADKLNEFYKDNPSYNKLFGDDIMQVGKYIGYLDMAASMAEESSALGEDPRVKAIVDRIHDWYDNFFHVIEDAGLRGDAGYIAEGYINHIWDKDKSDAEAWNTYVENFQRTKSANMHHRTVDTYIDGIKVGLVPKFNDIAQIMSYYSRQNNEAIANKKFLDDLSFLTVSETNKDGEVTRILPVLNSHKPGKFDEERYQMYHVPGVGDVWVLKDVARRFASIFGTMRTQDIPNWLSNIGKGYDLLGSTMKKIQLSISGFHMGALSEVALAQMRPDRGLKSIFKYILWDTVKHNGEIPAYAHPEDFKFAASHLVQLGATQDYAAADVNMITEKFRNYVKGLRNDEAFMKKVAGNTLNPFAVAMDWINKGMDKLLWNYLHDGLKIACFKHFAEQIDRKVEKEGLTVKQRDRLLDEAGQYVNDTFGGQYWELLNVSPATLKWLRRAFLSPDWLISTQRHFFANFGFGSLYDPRTFAQYLSDQLPGGKKRKAKREQAQQGDNAEPHATKPEDDGDIYRQFRSKEARLCYVLGVCVFFYTTMNGINAIMRARDEEKEKEKADEIRKTNPEYKSPYELAYPDGMKWYDYTMLGNALGQQTHLFLGRYNDGSEMYVRWGKQFREFPEMFIGSKGLDFPAPMIQRLMGKANPVIGLMRDNLGALGIWGFENQNDIADIQAKYGKTIGLLAMNARHFLPFSLPTQAEKEFKMMDLFMPSSKGFTRYKTVDYFKDFIKSGDMEGVTRTYRAATMNGINAEDCLKAAITTLKAEQKDEMRDGIVDVTTACAAYDKAKTLTEKKTIRNKMIKLLSAENYKAFTRAEAIQMVKDYMNGNDVAEKDNDKYIQLSTSSDVRADYRLNAIGKQAKTYADSIKNAAKRGDSQTADRLAQRYGAWLEIDALAKQERSVVNKLKKQLGHGNDKAIMSEIRQARRDFQSQIDQVQPPK